MTHLTGLLSVVDVFEVAVEVRLLTVARLAQVAVPHVRVVEAHVLVHARAVVRLEAASVRADVSTRLQNAKQNE